MKNGTTINNKRFSNLKISDDYASFDDNVSLSWRECTAKELENTLNDLHDKNKIMSIFLKSLGYELKYNQLHGWKVLDYTSGNDLAEPGKRFQVHKMMESQSTREDVDVDFLKELLEEGRLVEDLTMHLTDKGEEMTYREVVNLLNDMDSQITSFKPIAKEAIGVTRELDGKYQAALTGIGAFKQFLNRTHETFGENHFRFISSESLFELIEENFNKYFEYQLMKLKERG